MRIGAFRNKITIQQRTTSKDDVGQPLDTWTTFTIAWADIRVQKGLEAIKADKMSSMARASIRIRYTEGITAGMRVLQGSTTYNILSVSPDVATRKYVDLACEIAN